MYSIDETKHIQLKVLLSLWVICIFTPYSHHRHRKILPKVPDYPFRVYRWVKFLANISWLQNSRWEIKLTVRTPTFLELSSWGENTSLQACRDIDTNRLIVGSVSPTRKHSALSSVFPNVCFLHNFSSRWILHFILMGFFQNCLLIYWCVFMKHLKVLLIIQNYLSNRGKFPLTCLFSKIHVHLFLGIFVEGTLLCNA